MNRDAYDKRNKLLCNVELNSRLIMLVFNLHDKYKYQWHNDCRMYGQFNCCFGNVFKQISVERIKVVITIAILFIKNHKFNVK